MLMHSRRLASFCIQRRRPLNLCVPSYTETFVEQFFYTKIPLLQTPKMQFLRPLVPLRLERVFVVGELFRLLVNVVVAHVLLDVGDL